ncbi:MAG TPA: hypothetical protein VFL80_04415 [Thermoanaerobaculia bacterium]|nr:hypothetical protein [Thermoanaerobaculia bacterium]
MTRERAREEGLGERAFPARRALIASLRPKPSAYRLDARYWGPTDSFTTINASAGFLLSDRTTITVTGTNLANASIQQHVFGDIIARKITGQIRFLVR